MKVSRVDEMRKMDRTAIDRFGIPEALLMENAGGALFWVIQREFGVNKKKFAVFCGIGNNGGDGFVVARKIHSNGGEVKVYVLGDRTKLKGAAKINADIVSRLPIAVQEITDAESIRREIFHSHAIVDAIFGTGLTREVEGLYRDVIEMINQSKKVVFSVDIPSGIHGDTGQVMGASVGADFTVTFGLPKVGNMLYPGYEQCGKLYVTHISFPPSLYDTDATKIEINLPPEISPRDPNGHKGDFGEALFIAGASSYYGAPYFAALSFLKAGGGYSRLAAPDAMTAFLANKGSEIVFIPQKETTSGSIALENEATLLEMAAEMDMVVLGPGLSLDPETQALARELAKEIRKPLLLDGDGITAICVNPEILRNRNAETILTPHLGEMSRITKTKVSEIASKKTEILQHTAKDLNAVIVLKGAHSLIGYPDGRIYINLSGNAGMATAGSGDVLTRTIAAMFGLGLSVQDAVRKGVFIHGLSGDLAAEDAGEDGITAQDIMEYLPRAVKMDREGLPQSLMERYLGPEVV
jgi:NAD(P)H-hydrate epimerase